MTRAAGVTRAIACAVAIAGAGQARADQPRDTPTAIEVDRDLAPAGRVGLGFDGGEPVDAWGASIAASWIERPIELPADAFGGGSPATQPVRRRQTLALGGTIAIGDSVTVDAAVRGSHQVGERLRAAGNPAGLARFVLHDVRIGARIRVVGGAARAAFVRADLTLPSGDAAQFAGDARWTAAWALIGRATVGRDIALAATAGVRLHGAEVAVGDRLVGDALFAAAGATVPLSAFAGQGHAAVERVAVTGALLGALGDHVGGLEGPTPLELRLGAIVRPMPALAIGVHAGVGLVEQIGAPGVRAVLEVAWTPRVVRAAPLPAPRDLDDEDDGAPDD